MRLSQYENVPTHLSMNRLTKSFRIQFQTFSANMSLQQLSNNSPAGCMWTDLMIPLTSWKLIKAETRSVWPGLAFVLTCKLNASYRRQERQVNQFEIWRFVYRTSVLFRSKCGLGLSLQDRSARSDFGASKLSTRAKLLPVSSNAGHSKLWADLLSGEPKDIIANKWNMTEHPIAATSELRVIKDELQISQTKIRSDSQAQVFPTRNSL